MGKVLTQNEFGEWVLSDDAVVNTPAGKMKYGEYVKKKSPSVTGSNTGGQPLSASSPSVSTLPSAPTTAAPIVEDPNLSEAEKLAQKVNAAVDNKDQYRGSGIDLELFGKRKKTTRKSSKYGIDESMGIPKKGNPLKVSTPSGTQLSVDEDVIPKIQPIDSYISSLQQRVAAGVSNDEDARVVSASNGISIKSAGAYLSGQNDFGEIYDFEDKRTAQKEKISERIQRINSEFGIDDKFDIVMATPQSASEYAAKVENLYKGKIEQQKNQIQANFRANGLLERNEEIEDWSLPAARKVLAPIKNAYDQSMSTLKSVISNEIQRRVVEENPNDSREQLVQKAIDLTAKRDIGQNDAAIQEIRQRSDLKSAVDMAFNGFKDGTKGKIDVLNTDRGMVEFGVNQYLKKYASVELAKASVAKKQLDQEFSNGAITKEEYETGVGNLQKNYAKTASKVLPDDEIFKKYPTVKKQQIARQINDYLRDISGNEKDAAQDDGDTKDWGYKIFGAPNRYLNPSGYEAYKMRINKYLSDIGVNPNEDIVNDVVDNFNDYTKDYSLLGGFASNVGGVFSNTVKSLGDITGLRDDADALSEKKTGEIFPAEADKSDRIKGWAENVRNISNTTGQVIGQGLVQYLTATGGTAAGLSKTAANNLAFWSSGALSVYDQSYKDSFDFIDNKLGRITYAGFNSLFSAWTERMFPDKKLFEIPGLKGMIADFSKKVGSDGFTRELAEKEMNGLVTFAKNYVTNVGKEMGEEGATSLFESGMRYLYGDPDMNGAEAYRRAKETLVQTAIGTSVIGAWGAKVDGRNERNSSAKGLLYNASIYHDEAADAIKSAFDNGDFGEGQAATDLYNDKMQILNTAVKAKSNLDKVVSETGAKLNEAQKAVYVSNHVAEGVAKKQIEKIDQEIAASTDDVFKQKKEAEKLSLQEKISNLQSVRSGILREENPIDFNEVYEPSSSPIAGNKEDISQPIELDPNTTNVYGNGRSSTVVDAPTKNVGNNIEISVDQNLIEKGTKPMGAAVVVPNQQNEPIVISPKSDTQQPSTETITEETRQPEAGISTVSVTHTENNTASQGDESFNKNRVLLQEDINYNLGRPGSQYISAVDSDGDKVKIRVSDHNANARNSGNERVISFITKNERNPQNPKINEEWIVNENGDIVDWQGNETGESISQILKDYDIEYYFDDNGEKRYVQKPKQSPSIENETQLATIESGKGVSNKEGVTDTERAAMIEDAAKLVDEGSIKTPVYDSAYREYAASEDKADFEQGLQEIAQQAGDPATREAAIRDFGEGLVDLSEKMFPNEKSKPLQIENEGAALDTQDKAAELNKDIKAGFVTKSGNQKVEMVDGELKVYDTNSGEDVSRATYKKAIRGYVDAFDFTYGEVAPEPPQGISNEKELDTHIVETSENPYEIAEVYVNQEPETQPLSVTERMIADYGIGKVTGKSYNSFGDRNNMGYTKAKQYLSKTGESIDVVAKEMSDYYGIEISPNDIVSFMDRFPNGEAQALKEVESEISIKAATKFKELTGIDLNNEVAEQVINKEFNKLNKEQQLLAENDYETRQQLENEYWDTYTKTDNASKESPVSEVGQTERPDGLDKKQVDKILNALDKLKINTDNTLGVNLFPSTWNATVTLVKSAIRGGMAIADALNKGLIFMQKTLLKSVASEEGKSFKEVYDGFTEWLSEKTKTFSDAVPKYAKILFASTALNISTIDAVQAPVYNISEEQQEINGLREANIPKIEKIIKDFYSVNDEEYDPVVMQRAISLWEAYGMPTMLDDTVRLNRAFAVDGKREGDAIFNIKNFDDFIAEMAHIVQFKSGAKLDTQQYGSQKEYDAVEYERIGSAEYDAHKILEGIIGSYIMTGPLSEDAAYTIFEGSDQEFIDHVKKSLRKYKADVFLRKDAIQFLDSIKIGKGKVLGLFPGIQIPVVIWNGGIEVIKKSIQAGIAISDAIKSGIDYIKSELAKDGSSLSSEDEAAIVDLLSTQLGKYQKPKITAEMREVYEGAISDYENGNLSRGDALASFSSKVDYALQMGDDNLAASWSSVRDYFEKETESHAEPLQTGPEAVSEESEDEGESTEDGIKKFKKKILRQFKSYKRPTADEGSYERRGQDTEIAKPKTDEDAARAFAASIVESRFIEFQQQFPNEGAAKYFDLLFELMEENKTLTTMSDLGAGIEMYALGEVKKVSGNTVYNQQFFEGIAKKVNRNLGNLKVGAELSAAFRVRKRPDSEAGNAILDELDKAENSLTVGEFTDEEMANNESGQDVAEMAQSEPAQPPPAPKTKKAPNRAVRSKAKDANKLNVSKEQLPSLLEKFKEALNNCK